MRNLILALPALMVVAPAVAAEPLEQDIARALPSPDALAGVGDLVSRVMSAMLDVEVGDVLDAVDPDGRRDARGQTLGDIAGRDDPYFEERMHRSVDATVAHADDVMADIAILAPRLLRTFENVSRDIEDATRDLPSRR